MSSGPTIPNLAGGPPIRHYDLAPSVLFIILYAPFLLAMPFRLLQSITRRRQSSKFVGQHGPNPIGRAPNLISVFIRLLLFIPIRIVALIIRAIQASDSYPPDPFTSSAATSLGLIITEQVLISIGFFFLLNAVQTLIVSHISYLPPDDTIANRMRRVTRLSEVVILVAIALSILAATKYSSVATDPSTANQVKTYRIVSSAIGIAVAGLNIVISAFLLTSRQFISKRASGFILVTSLILIIIPAYRLSSIEHGLQSLADAISLSTKVKFWVLQIVPEFIVATLFAAVNIGALFNKDVMPMSEAEMQDRGV